MDEQQQRHRIFVAVPLDHGLFPAVRVLQQRLADAGVAPRWIPVENLHLTLRFLGRISPAQLARVQRAVRGGVEGAEPFPIRFGGLGAFPSLRRPQVIWTGVTEGAERLKALAARLDDELARQRFPKEPRPFRPHLTLARVRDPGRMGALEAASASLAGFQIGDQSVESLVVMESLLRPSGAIYTPVEEVPLSHPKK